MKYSKFFFVFLLFTCTSVHAEECCSAQGGITGTYNEEGYAICKDETVSYDDKCRNTLIPKKNTEEKKYRRGCTDQKAKNYSERAEVDDGSCTYYIYGCTDKASFNYNEKAEIDDGSCKPKKEGCMNDKAINYDKEANIDNKTCQYEAIIVKEEKIPFKTIYKRNKSLLLGEDKILQRGIEGSKKIKYRIVIDDLGKEIKKEKLDEKIMKESKDQWIEEGSKNPMFDFTILLYGMNLFALVIIFLYHRKHAKLPYLFCAIQDFSVSSSFLTILCKILLYLFYFLFSLPLLDLFIIISKTFQRKF